MYIEKDYEPLTLAMKLVVLENFLITLPAIVLGMIFKDLVVFQKIIIMGNVISVALAYIIFLMGLIFYIPKKITNDNAIIKFCNFIVEILWGSTMNTALWSSTFWFLSYYHLIPNITDDVRLLTTISLIMTLPFIISFYILFEFGDKILKKYEKDNNGNN